MKKALKIVGLVLGVVILIGAVLSLVIMNNAGAFKSLEPQFAGMCKAIEGQGSAEDIIVDPDTGLAYVSALDRLGAQSDKSLHGTIATYDLASGAPSFTMADLPAPVSDIHPHGLSLYKDESGKKRLFVINHGKGGKESVEIFDLGPTASSITQKPSPGIC